MGQDMWHYSREVAIRSHGGLVDALKDAREALREAGPKKYAELIKKIDKALDNASIA
jgi:hypothetical protein